jgi:hypothetical protein
VRYVYSYCCIVRYICLDDVIHLFSVWLGLEHLGVCCAIRMFLFVNINSLGSFVLLLNG